MVMQKVTGRFRDLLKGGDVLVKPGAYNALTAKIIETAGFKTCGVSGYAVSATLLGKPDVGLLTGSEMIMMSRYIADAVDIPVIADADTGYGNAINVIRTVEEFIKAGLAGVHIEDQVAPKRCGHVAGKEIISVEEAVGKYRAAAKVRDELDRDFVLIARTDARGVTNGCVSDVIERGKAYLDAGADMIFPEGLVSKEELEEVSSILKCPIHFNRTGLSPLLSIEELEDLGISMVSFATGALRCGTHAIWEFMHDFKERDVAAQVNFLDLVKNHPVGDIHKFIGFDGLREMEEEFLPVAKLAAKYDRSLGYLPAGIEVPGD